MFLVAVIRTHGFCITNLEVPKHAERHSNQILNCTVEEGENELDYIKWFHNDVEFMRSYFGNHNKIIFKGNSDIKFNAISGQSVTLYDVDRSASGEYRCMAASTFPDIIEDSKTSDLTVVVLPDEQPKIEGDIKGLYAVGDTVNLNCTSAPSVPAAHLVWFVNDEQAPDEHTHTYPEEEGAKGLLVSHKSLTFHLSEHHCIDGELKWKCTASIETMYLSSIERTQQINNNNINNNYINNNNNNKVQQGKSWTTSTANPASSVSCFGKGGTILSLILLLLHR
ncbi:hypothetical protein Pmani_023440 [Petrolisthes manimaculis]|uniref:Ig-like domain-containing protein n=1 Tax=Petrolisthes manimaculis TaxID=1843537 RepID=A0AAE1PBP5_9EUCA|nr:hypothetical protein Pmani_023440 [Petrolisthes manimaculis]